MRKAARAALQLALGLVPFAVQAQMSTPENFAVSSRGSATYSIPIRVPPGIAGMEPKLSLDYDSSTGNGAFGLSWHLGGLSAITRCARTVAQDAVKGEVRFDANDRFCMDGKRLMVLSGQTYGAAGSEYRTEIPTFARIIANGSAGLSGPASFTVWTKTGQILQYGATADSQVSAPVSGTSTPVVWAINQVADRKGNYMKYTYTTSPGKFEYVLSRIDYTGNSSVSPVQAPNQALVINYKNTATYPRSDQMIGYGPMGIPVQMTQWVDSIQTFASGSLVRTYTPSYGTSTSAYSPTSGRLIMSGLQECAPSASTGSCLPSQNFSWVLGDLTSFATVTSATPFLCTPSLTSVTVLTGDINGDGLADLVCIYTDPSAAQWWGTTYVTIGLSDGQNFNVPNPAPALTTLAPTTKYWRYMLGDIDGDGKADLIRISDTGTGSNLRTAIDIYLGQAGTAGFTASTGQQLTTWFQQGGYGSGTTANTVYLTGTVYVLADVNGDGRADLVSAPASVDTSFYSSLYPSNQPLPQQITTALSVGKSFDFTHQTITTFTPQNLPARVSSASADTVFKYDYLVADINGDGRQDLVQITTSASGDCSQTNAHTVNYKYWVTPWISNGTGFTAGAANPIPVANFLSAVGATAPALPPNPVPCMLSQPNWIVGDFNGDGRADLVGLFTSFPTASGPPQYFAYVLLSGGTDTNAFRTPIGPISLPGNMGYAIDVNGDGKAELLLGTGYQSAGTASYCGSGWQVYSWSNASSTFVATGAAAPFVTTNPYVCPHPADINGDGRVDLVTVPMSQTIAQAVQPVTVMQSGTPFDVITHFDNGLSTGVDLNYAVLSERSVVMPTPVRRVQMRMAIPPSTSISVPPVYTKGSSGAWPTPDYIGPLKVVAWTNSDNGAGSKSPAWYAYAGALIDDTGRGFLGFNSVTRLDVGTNTGSLTNFWQGFPFSGMVSQKERYVLTATGGVGQLLSQTTNTQGTVATATGAAYPFVASSVEKTWNPQTGNPLPTITKTNTFDTWGCSSPAASPSTYSASDGYASSTAITYVAPDTTNWVFCHASTSATTKTSPSSPIQTPTLAAFSVSVSTQSGGVSSTTGAVSATATVTPVGGVAPIFYTWSGGGNGITASHPNVNSPQATFTANFATPGVLSTTFTLTARDAAGRVATVSPYPVALAAAPASIIPAATNWGTVGVASDSGDWPTIKNNSTTPILITAHTLVSGPSGAWAWQGTAGYCQPGTTVLASGASCSTFVGIGGLATPGSYTATNQLSFQIQSNPVLTYSTQQTYTFAVAGTTSSASSLAFGNQAYATTSAAQSLTLTNNASNGGPLYVTGISVTGANAANFPMTKTCGATLAAGATCSVSVQFAPTSITNGQSASILVQGGYDRMQAGTDSGYRPTTTGVNFSVPLSGNGIGSSATLSSGALAFGAVTYGSAVPTKSLVFTNSGNTPMTLSGLSGLSAPFSISSNNCTSIAANATCTIVVAMAMNSFGSWSQAGISSAGATINAAVGTASGSVTGTLATLTAGNLAFGTVSYGSTSPVHSLTFRNDGNAAMTLSGLSGLSAPFSVTANTCSGIAPAASCTISVTMATTTTGSWSMTATTAGANGNASLPVSGTVSVSGTDTLPWTNGSTITFCYGQFASTNATFTFSISGAAQIVTVSPSNNTYSVTTNGWTSGASVPAGTYSIKIQGLGNNGTTPLTITFSGTGDHSTASVYAYNTQTCP